MNGDQREFHLEEFKQLRAEVGNLVARIENLGKYSVVVAAGVFTWLATQSLGVLQSGGLCTKLPVTGSLVGYAWYIPLASTVFAGAMALVAFFRIVDMGTYLRRLETALGHGELGWESLLKSKPWIITISTSITWVVLVGGTGFVGYTMEQKASKAPLCAGLTDDGARPPSGDR
jgi:hypothetical protein